MKISAVFFFVSFLSTLFITAQNEDQDKEVLSDTLPEVMVMSLLRPQKITRAPASVQVLTKNDLDRFAGSNTGELIARLQGVEFTRYGVDGITFNARGLNSAFNNKILQIVDGRISTAALSGGLPVFNNGSTIKDDIQQIEVVVGPQSALFGPNAHNGVFNTITKDARLYPGTSVSLSAGNQYQFSGRFRHAQKIDDRWAWKVTGEYASGREFQFIDSVYVGNPSEAIPEHNVDFDFKHFRGEAHLYYNFNPEAEIVISGGASNNDFLQVTTSGRNQMRGLGYSFLQARYKSPHFYANIYNTWGTLGDSYTIAGYTQIFWMRSQPGALYLPPEEAEQAALNGAGFEEKSRRFNADLQYHKNFEEAGLFLVAGLDFENSRPNTTDGTTLVGEAGDISISQIGAVLQLEKKLLEEFRLIGALRYDHNDNFDDLFAPKFTLVKDLDMGNIRLGWAKAYALPSIQNQYASIRDFFFGNGGEGINYIPNNALVSDPGAILTTNPLKPEEVNTWEIGYKGQPIQKVWIDANAFYGSSKNFITPAMPVGGRAISVNEIEVEHNPVFAGTVSNDTLRGASFFTFFNYGKAQVYGLDLGISYYITPSVNLALKYSWLNAEFEENDANKDGQISDNEKSLNAPNHRGVAQLTVEDLLKERLSLSLGARMVQEYDFYSGNQVGSSIGAGTRTPPNNFNYGPLGGFTTFNFGAEYLYSKNVVFNFNMTNIFNTRQIEFVGSPSIGRLAMASIKISN
ncbi:iron complex outermembrane receptor protein [Christiangramia gaetbulicola]|uniref:Iron complex outermembrane receptor protein n=1 Tax=Christiangramia gaetbulicola TaxID=703340 RepID=A0A2T6ACH1_9FLAO|nr:TonB-dependent receptor [Christiangramia gaetbulicola]PTX41482.1 iron complex outermembrane receptor protein [Christiangramia gaetbulicola]